MLPPLRDLAGLVGYLKVTESEWDEAVDRARRLVESGDFQHIAQLVARGLELKDGLDAEDLRRLIPDRLLDKYGVKERDPCCT